MAKTFDPTLSRYIDNVLSNPNHIGSAMRVLYHRIAASNRSKFVTYRTINTSFDVHSVYFCKDCSSITEAYRLSFSRIRLSSHNLRIETGRWSRIQRDHRLCPCGSIQDKDHVLAQCQSTPQRRSRKSSDFPEILYSNECADFKLIYDVVNIFQWPVHGLKLKRLIDCEKLLQILWFCILAHALRWGVVAVITLYSLASHGAVDMTALCMAGEWKVFAATDFPLPVRA